MPETQIKVDPILVAVIGNRLDAITKDIGETMLRTSRSPIFSEARDFVTAVFDAKGRLVAQTHYIPVIGGSTPFAQQAIIDAFGNDVHEGDVFIHNDPFMGGNHLPDITITRPVFHGGELVFWSMTKGHNADVGGGGVVGYNPEATDVWAEGLRIPPARLIERGRVRTDMWEMILMNVRLRAIVEGDLSCQVGATSIGERGLIAVLDKYGRETVDAAIEELLSASERQVRAEVGRIPDGVYQAERKIDHDGVVKDQQHTIRLAVRVKGEQITFDFTGSGQQAQGFINSPLANTVASAHLALFASIDPNIRYNGGAIGPVDVIAPEGTIVNPVAPAPTTACTVAACEAITEAIWIALSEAIPSQVQAAWARWCAPATMGMNPRTGRFFAELHFMAKGGGGATEGFDGWDHVGTVVCLGGARSPDPELHELVSPYLVEEFEYEPDSAGAGEWRGGLGVRYRWKVLADNIGCAMYGSGARDETAPVGLLGGQGTERHVMSLTHEDGSVTAVDGNSFYTLMAGDVFEIVTSGGGGFGDALRRPPEKVLRDVIDGVVTVERAREAYGVVVDAQSLELDAAATRTLRRAA